MSKLLPVKIILSILMTIVLCDKVKAFNGVERGGWPDGLLNFKSRVLCEIPTTDSAGEDDFVVLLSDISRGLQFDTEGMINIMVALFVKDGLIYKQQPIDGLIINFQAQSYKQVRMEERIYEGSGTPFFLGSPRHGEDDPFLDYWLGDNKNLPEFLIREIHFEFRGTLSVQQGSLPEKTDPDLGGVYKCRRSVWYIPLLESFIPSEQIKLLSQLDSLTFVAGDFYFGLSSIWYMKLENLFLEVLRYQSKKDPVVLANIYQLIGDYRERLATIKQELVNFTLEYQAKKLVHVNFPIFMKHFVSIITRTEEIINDVERRIKIL